MGQAAERIRVREFRAIAQELSIRANHVLENLGVHDVSALLSLTREDLVRAWSCGKKTIAEIEHLQARLRETSETAVTEEIRARLSFHESTNEVFDAVRSMLSVRGVHAIVNMGVDSLEKLMAVTKEELLDCRNCGRKTAAEILRLQAEIGDFARHVAQESGEFRSEMLLSAPCVAAPDARHERRSFEEHMLADAENPAPWLMTWVHGLARTEKKARAFMLRKGMLGLPPMTLDRVGEQVGNVTRERARQMDTAVERRAAVPLQQQRLRPLIDAAAAVVKERGGLIALEELTEAVLCGGEDGDQLRFATELIAFFSTLQVWRNAGLRLQRDGAIRNGDTRLLVCRLAGLVQKVAAAAADERHGDDLWSIERDHLKQKLRETYAAEFGDPPLTTVSDAMLDALLKKRRQGTRRPGEPCPYNLLEEHFVKKLGYKEQQIYSVAREPDVCMYHPGCVIHLRSLAWDESKQQALECLAGRVYADAVRAGRSFGHVFHLLESEDLPSLPPNTHWSRVLIADLLTKGGRYVVLGNRREAFVPRENKHGIQNFEDLVCVLLNEDWGGAANHTAFENALAKAGVIKSRVTAVMLGAGEKVVIENGEIIVKDLLVDAQTP